MNPILRLHRLALLAAFAACLPACAWLPFGGDDDAEEEVESSEAALYRRAQTGLNAGNFTQSITRLERLEARFPFGRYAEQAQLELIYANFMARDHEAAQAASDRFIRLHPQHANVDYAYYMRGLTSLSKNRGSGARFMKTDISRRDVTNMKQAFSDFNELITRFPRSEFAKDAQQRMIFVRNVLAASEVNIAAYYLGRAAYVAAANRARHVIENYSQTPAVADALAVLVEANTRLGLDDSAADALKVLALNFPEYEGFDDAGHLRMQFAAKSRERSWLNIVTFGALDRERVPPVPTVASADDADTSS